MGKSRLLRELGNIRGTDNEGSVTVFYLCFRSDYEGSAACVPGPDIPARDYLNKREEKPTVLPAKAWSIKAYMFFTALFIELADIAAGADGLIRLRALCDPDTLEKRKRRHEFIYAIVQGSQPRFFEVLTTVEAEIARNHRPTDAFDEAVATSALEMHDAARRLRQTMRPEDWFILAIDEASGICPPHLVAGADGFEAKVDVAKECLAIIVRAFSKPHPDSGSTSKIKTPRPERFWLALTDTNSSISTLVPPKSESPSARLGANKMKRVPPYCPIILDLGMESRDTTTQLLQMSPLQHASEHNLARTGRPLWRSLLSIDEPSRPEPPHVDPDDSWHLEVYDEIRQQHVRSFANPEFVLEKLLGALHEDTGAWRMTDERYMALLFQRLDLVTTQSSTLTDTQRIDRRKFQQDRVHYHLGGLLSMPQDGLDVEVIALNEPLVSAAATGFFRSEGRDRNGASLITNRTGLIWRSGWDTFRTWSSAGPPLEKGAVGELMAQACFCVAHDRAKRPTWKGKKERSECKAAYRGESAYVHLKELFKKLISTQIHEDLGRELGRFAFVDYQRFSRAADYGFDRRDLIVAFWMRQAIVGAKGQKSWDFVIPVYCADLTKAFDPEYLTWIEVQVKTRAERKAPFMAPQTILHGSLLSQQEKDRGVKPSHKFVPRKSPMLIWLEMSAGAEAPPKSEGDAPRKERPLPTILPKRHAGRKFWLIDFPLFDQRNHPVLQEVWPEEPFPQLLPSMSEDLARWGPELQTATWEALSGVHKFKNC